MDRQRIKIVDTQFAHAPSSFGCGDVKGIQPDYFSWYRGIENINDVVVVTESFFHRIDSLQEKTKIALILEPPAINSMSYEFIREYHYKFHTILTYNKNMLPVADNIKFYPFGGCWIHPLERCIYDKTRGTSIIASWKRETAGHKLRHLAVSLYRNKLDAVLGNGYQKIESKLEGLKDFRYSIVAENDDCDDFFSEKLIDCFVTGTIPIFYGTKNIGKYFNMDGMLTFTNAENLEWSLAAAGESFYKDNIAAIKDNFFAALQYATPENWLWKNILSDIF